MKHFRFFHLAIATLGLGLLSPLLPADDKWDQHPIWQGEWQFSAEAEKLLGFDQAMDKPKHPKTIQFSFLVDRKAAIAVLGQEKAEASQKLLEKMNQKIVAVGKWNTDSKFKGYKDRDSVCFVTQKDGITFLWIGSPENSLMGAEVHFVKGKSNKHDLLLLDFAMPNWRKNSSFSWPRDSVGFKRISKQP